MRHFCRIEETPEIGAVVSLPPEEGRHLSQVLRVRDGQEVGLLNGHGYVATAKVIAAHRHRIELEILTAETLPPPEIRVTLAQAAIRNTALDTVIEKAVELGVDSIDIIETARAVAGLDARSKQARWERIAIAAMKQSGNPWIPKIRAWDALASWIQARNSSAPILLCDLMPGAQPIAAALSDFASQSTEELCVLIGPEGDFTPEERERILTAGAHSVSLGTTILRSETAAMLASGIALRILSDCREISG